MMRDNRRSLRCGQLTGIPLPEVLEHDAGIALQQTMRGITMKLVRQAQGGRKEEEQTRERLGRENRRFAARPGLAV